MIGETGAMSDRWTEDGPPGGAGGQGLCPPGRHSSVLTASTDCRVAAEDVPEIGAPPGSLALKYRGWRPWGGGRG